MYWPDTNTGVDVEPPRKPVASLVRKFFSEGGIGEPPTVPGGDWFNQITNELLNVLAAAGIEPSKTDDDQLLAAIKELSKCNFGIVVNLQDYSDLKSAIDALPVFGGTVFVPIGNHFAGDWNYNTDYMSKANISIVGQKMPTWNDDASALTGGSVIEGRFNVFAHNFSVENVGFDMGKNVIADRYGGADTLTANHPLGGTWDAFAFAQPNMSTPLAQRRGFRAENVIALCKQSLTVGHAFLAEGFDGGYIDNVIGIYSIHATVIKSQNVRVGSIAGYMASGEGLIIKSNAYSPCGNIQIASVVCERNLPNCAPHSTPTIAKHGLYLEPSDAYFTGPIQIGSVVAKGSAQGVSAGGLVGTDIQIGSVIADGFGGAMRFGVNLGDTGQFRRINIGSLICNNVVDALYYKHPNVDTGEPMLHIGSMQVTYCSGIAVTAKGHAKVVIDSLELAYVAMAYNIADTTARILVGNAVMTDVVHIFQSAIPLSSQWGNFGGANPSFAVDLHDYRVRVTGLVVATAGAGSVISSLLPALRPSLARRFIAYKNNGARTFCLIGVDPTLGIVLEDGTAPATGDYISLENVMWEI